MATYLKKEISEWNTTDLSNWLVDNKYPGISELCQNNSLSGYDLFFINDDILKNELGLSSFHERKVTLKLINKLIYEHLKLNVINSNGDNVILTLDNNQDTSLGELSEYIGGMFNINPKDILYKDNSKTEVLSPTLKIVKLLILYPRLYKTLNVFNMKDYHQSGDNENNENLESKNNEYPINLNNNNSVVEEGAASENESEFPKPNRINNMNMKMNFDYNVNAQNDNMKMIKNNNMKEKIQRDNYAMDEMNENNKIIYNDEENMKNNKIIYNEDYDINNNKKFKSDQRIYRNNKNENVPRENTDEMDNENEENENNWNMNNNDLKFRMRTNYRENNNNVGKGYNTLRNRNNLNFNEKPYQENFNNNKFKNMENKENYYNNAMD